MRYRLRTLLILLAVLPPLLWGAFALWQRVEVWRESRRVRSQPGVVINVPALGPVPVAIDFGFPAIPQDAPETGVSIGFGPQNSDLPTQPPTDPIR